MPVDQKRLNGPETTLSYRVVIENEEDPQNDLSKRRDGREDHESRKMFVKTGMISQAKGSAYIEMGKTKVVCSVFDPRETPYKNGYSVQGVLYCDFKFATFSCKKRRSHEQDAEEREYSLIMRRALEPAVCRHEFPNFQVDIYALVLNNGGSSLGAAIMAGSLALANAGIPMFGLVTAVTVGIRSNTCLFDPTNEEEEICSIAPKDSETDRSHGIIMQASLPQHDQITELYFAGDINLDATKLALEKMTEVSKDICPVLRQCVVKFVMKYLKDQEEEKYDSEK